MVGRGALRVHLASVARRDVERVCGPVEDDRADELLLLSAGAGDDFEPERNEVRDRLSRTRVRMVETDITDPAAVANAVGLEIEDLGDNFYSFNLSAGPRSVALGGMMAAAFWDIVPYRVVVDEIPAVEHDDVDEYEGYLYEDSIDVGVYRPGQPPVGVLTALDILENRGGRLRQSFLKNELERRGVIRPKRADDLTPQAKHAQFNRIGSDLDDLELAEKEGRGHSTSWNITPRGQTTLRIFDSTERIRGEPDTATEDGVEKVL